MSGRTGRAALAAVLAAGVLGVLPGQAFAVVGFVDTAADDDDGSCVNGDCTLREAIATAPDSTVVTINAPHDPVLTLGQITISKNLTIVGQGALATRIDQGTANQRVFTVNPGYTVTMTDLEITGGEAPDGGPGSAGTAVLDGGFGLSGESGGAILNYGTLTLTRTRVTGNEAGAGGTGGDGFSDATPTHAGGGGTGGYGGGVSSTGPLTVIDSTFSGNKAGAGGPGGAGAANSNAGNQSGSNGGTGGTGGDGGAIYAAGGLTITNSTLGPNNVAGKGSNGGAAGQSLPGPPPSGTGVGGAGGMGGNGGAIALGGSTATATNSTLANNVAGAGGNAASPSLSLLSRGAGGHGGALYNIVGPTFTGVHVTIAQNTTGLAGTAGLAAGAPPGNGGGIFNVGTVTLTNSIVASNDAIFGANDDNCANQGTLTDGGGLHSIAFPIEGCTGFDNVDPALSGLAPRGGPTETMRIDPTGFADDVIPVADCQGLTRDQRGPTFVRPFPAGGLCDVGAFEFQASDVLPTPAATPAPPPPGTTGATPRKKCKKGRKLRRGKCVKKKKKK